MNCKKCGNEIKEGNEYCTNCGHSLNETKINILKEYKIPIIIIAVWIVIIGVIIGIKAINSKKQDNQNTSTNNEIVAENTTNNDIEQENETVIEDDDTDEEKSLLEQIELIDPNNEYPVCYNEYGEFWILDGEGKKIYFNDIEGFENAVEIYKERINNTFENSESFDTNNNANNDTSDKENFVRIPDLTRMTEQEAVNKVRSLNVPYEVEYREDLSYKEEGIVIDQTTHTQIIKDRGGNIVAAYSLRILYPGETLAIVVNKYEERTFNFNVDIVCLIKQYLKECEAKGIEPITNQFTFNLKVNNKTIYTETVQRATVETQIKKALTGTLDEDMLSADDLLSSRVTDRFLIHPNCGTLKKSSYTGYGVFDFLMTINDVIVRNDRCDLYHTVDGYNYVKSKDNSLEGASGYEEIDGYGNELKVPNFNISTYQHGAGG